MECVEFLTPPHSDKQYGGRISGSLQWRLSRGECETKANKHIWKPDKLEIESRKYVSHRIPSRVLFYAINVVYAISDSY